jgi:hypothetical protein
MHGSSLQRRVDEQRNIERALVQGNARLCSSPFGAVCKALWPLKTAENLASRTGLSVRAAAYEVSGERDPSAQSILAVMEAITPKWKGRGNGTVDSRAGPEAKAAL